MELYVSIFSVSIITMLVIWVHRWRNPKCNGKLPPGSMGLPLLGETLQFFKPDTSNDLQPFVKERVKRYGPIFKTSLVGQPVIISTDQELNDFVFQQEGNLFQSWYPETFMEIFGQDSAAALHGYIHKYIKNLVLKLFGPESLRERLLHDVEKSARLSLCLWSEESSVELKDAISTGRKKVMKLLKDILAERMNSPNRKCIDFFDCVVKELKKEKPVITEAIALDLMFVLLFASFETTSSALTLAIKFLSENPEVLEELTKEHEAILGNRKYPDSGITWQEYKSMNFTFQVIHETTRLANIVPGIFRKAMKEIHVNGYTIPAGWGVMVCPPAVHLNPRIYEDPLLFNPWRWKGKSELSGGSKNFMAFGGGVRFCVGADFSKLQMAIFLHCLVTKYRWKPVKGGNIIRTPGLGFPDGYHIQISQKRMK
ncbi:cytochrome P450 87A3-like isoform X2 [Asparagus officinalis]|uniref:cytochrome P450 87A3-like isoform X2 n=1 Tax=Asparagus officinalis TaxID=4686 RepID=UPI00098DE267|nr:cytochrome P450 87A3-like isoform X2 [Asparagus officinalis]